MSLTATSSVVNSERRERNELTTGIGRKTAPDTDSSVSGVSFPQSINQFRPHSAGGNEPDEYGLRETPTAPRFDGPVQLETRGVTSHLPKVRQGTLFRSEVIFAETIVTKLKESGNGDVIGKLGICHSIETVKKCCGCGKVSTFFNRCELFYCPMCAPRLARERRESIEWWSQRIEQPKHVVLTIRNTQRICQAQIKVLKAAFSLLSRKRVFRACRGGFYTIEVTNEDKGWHIHIHALCDARWIDASELSIAWGKLVGQDFAIVKVKDCRKADYLKEVTKYAVKGSQLAGWSGDDIAAFIKAFTGLRLFGVFGSLYGKRTEWREWIDAIQGTKPQCDCGCDDWRYLSPDEYQFEQLQREHAPPVIAAPAIHPELALQLRSMHPA